MPLSFLLMETAPIRDIGRFRSLLTPLPDDWEGIPQLSNGGFFRSDSNSTVLRRNRETKRRLYARRVCLIRRPHINNASTLWTMGQRGLFFWNLLFHLSPADSKFRGTFNLRENAYSGLHVSSCFTIRRNAAGNSTRGIDDSISNPYRTPRQIGFNSAFARVICGQDEIKPAVKAVHQIPRVSGRPVNRSLRVVRIGRAEARCR